jgi:hypothetical protein
MPCDYVFPDTMPKSSTLSTNSNHPLVRPELRCYFINPFGFSLLVACGMLSGVIIFAHACSRLSMLSAGIQKTNHSGYASFAMYANCSSMYVLPGLPNPTMGIF